MISCGQETESQPPASVDMGYDVETLDHLGMLDYVRDHDNFLLDVREKIELFTDGKIAESVNIPLGEVRAAFSLNEKSFASRYCRPKPTVKQVICIYCRTGPRAKRAAEKLIKMRYTNLKISAHGIKDWTSHGGDTEFCAPRNLHFTGLH